ncbi:dTDP-4-dehydrorhamnose 3,5-epimerase [Ilumatobacter nonamiensis]|uniref:dTDP-4-dehydrorhamnose 3,5-epimerase n=1 Tax=Ilumatobacter nonamiensis TaxID=467093 RepID=UPI0003499351|nr:dTDP-4-dehydrorhamnose 3,5-epimerase [Ilumatobacter nonamiensis]
MKLVPTALGDVVEIQPVRHGDARGWFSEVFTASAMAEAGIVRPFIQDNESFSAAVGTLRGIHYQLEPFAQDKIVRVVRGSVLDVAVDLRRGSPTFGEHVTVTLTGDAGNQLLVPAGFGHGFVTLQPDTHVAYKVTAPYAPERERSIRWDDPTLSIDWQLAGADPMVSERDAEAPLLTDQPDLFDLPRSETPA